MLPDRSNGRLVGQEALTELIEGSIETMDECAVVIIRYTEILWIASNVDNLGFNRVQLIGQQLPWQVRLNEPWTGQIVHTGHRIPNGLAIWRKKCIGMPIMPS